MPPRAENWLDAAPVAVVIVVFGDLVKILVPQNFGVIVVFGDWARGIALHLIHAPDIHTVTDMAALLLPAARAAA
jgi:hypothetical protein